MHEAGCFPAAFVAVALAGVAIVNPALAFASAAALAAAGIALTRRRLRSAE